MRFHQYEEKQFLGKFSSTSIDIEIEVDVLK